MFDQQAHLVAFDVEERTPIMFLDAQELSLVTISLGLGIVTDLFMAGIAVGAMLVVASKKLKRGAKRGATQHFLWSLGLQADPTLARLAKPAWINDFTN